MTHLPDRSLEILKYTENVLLGPQKQGPAPAQNEKNQVAVIADNTWISSNPYHSRYQDSTNLRRNKYGLLQ